MPGAVWVQTCAEADFNTATRTCAAPSWELQQQQAFFPDIPADHLPALQAQIAYVFALAWCLRKLRKSVQ